MLAAALAFALAQDAIDWKTGYDEAVRLSKQLQKPLHVYFTAKT